MQRAAAPPNAPRVDGPRPDAPRCQECFDTGFLVGRDGIAHPCPCGAHQRAETERRLAEASIPPRFAAKTFATFSAATPAHREVRDTAISFAESFDPGTHDGLLLRGRTGCGKTHIAAAILRVVVQRGFSGRFVNFQNLLARLRESYGNQSDQAEADILAELTGVDLVVIDDLGAEMTTDWVRDRLYLIVNERYEADRPLVITTNCSEAELDQRIGPRTASRLYEMCGLPFPRFPETDWRRAQMR